MIRRTTLLANLLLAVWIAGCKGNAAPQSDLRTISMQIGSKAFTLEVADTFASRQRGLMQRDSMPGDHGMIFVFEDETDRAFWMKNTRIPLDIIYISRSGTIVSIKSMAPYDLAEVPSDGPAKYAIELNAGTAATTGVKAGQTLEIPSDAREPLTK